MEQGIPLLVVNKIEAKAERPNDVLAEITLGGCPEHVELDLSIPGLAVFVHMPDAVEHCRAVKELITDLVVRRHRGDPVTLPVDLSDTVRQASEPWPVCPSSGMEPGATGVAAAASAIEVKHIEIDPSEPGLQTVHLSFGGTRTIVTVDRRGGSGTAARFRFVAGVHPWHLTPAEQRILLVTLLATTENKRRPDGAQDRG